MLPGAFPRPGRCKLSLYNDVTTLRTDGRPGVGNRPRTPKKQQVVPQTTYMKNIHSGASDLSSDLTGDSDGSSEACSVFKPQDSTQLWGKMAKDSRKSTSWARGGEVAFMDNILASSAPLAGYRMGFQLTGGSGSKNTATYGPMTALKILGH